MDTNFRLNLFLVVILFIIYCFSESDLKVEKFQDSNKEKNKIEKPPPKEEDILEEEEREEKEVDVNADYLNRTKALETKYTNKSENSIETMNQYQKSLKTLGAISQTAETQAQKSLNDAINIANGNNKEKKEPERTSIIKKESDYTKKLHNGKSEFINTKSLNGRENNPPNNLPIPQDMNTTNYGLFNKHNLPPSSRPNVIDIFDNTESFVESEIMQHNLGGDGHVFIPKLEIY